MDNKWLLVVGNYGNCGEGTESASKSLLKPNSVDYFFTDPPFGGHIMVSVQASFFGPFRILKAQATACGFPNLNALPVGSSVIDARKQSKLTSLLFRQASAY
jgi:hypothetical protein